jgi:hypothetical protein
MYGVQPVLSQGVLITRGVVGVGDGDGVTDGVIFGVTDGVIFGVTVGVTDGVIGGAGVGVHTSGSFFTRPFKQ